MKTWEIQTGASTRSRRRQTMNHTITSGQIYRDVTVQTEDDARYVAEMEHIELLGWNSTVWIRESKEV